MEIDDSVYNSIRAKYNPHVPPLKKVLKKSGFFSYFFIHRKKIKKWNNESDLIIFKHLGLQMSIADDFKSRLDLIFINYLFKLATHIKVLVKTGWKMNFISIYEYNIIINFKKFYDRFYQVIKSEDIVYEDFLLLERAYVKLTYRQSYIDAILNIFEKYLITKNSRYMDDPDKYDDMMMKLKILFEKSSLPHSLRELILAKNISDLRSFHRWGEIFPPISTDIVQKEWYNCDREVYTNLVKYYKDIREGTKSLIREREQLLRLKNNCIIDDEETPPILVKFYEGERHNWILDNNNYYLQFILVADGLTKHLDTLIFREWDIIDDHENRLHQRLIKDDELPSLHRKLKREVEMAFVYLNTDSSPSVSVKDFRDAESPDDLINSEQQKKLTISYKEILDTLLEISYLILAYGDIAIESGYTKHSFLKFMLDSPEIWAGKPVFSLFNYYIELIWTTCGYFNHETFKNMDQRLFEIEENLKTMTSERDRIDAFNIMENTVVKKSE